MQVTVSTLCMAISMARSCCLQRFWSIATCGNSLCPLNKVSSLTSLSSHPWWISTVSSWVLTVSKGTTLLNKPSVRHLPCFMKKPSWQKKCWKKVLRQQARQRLQKIQRCSTSTYRPQLRQDPIMIRHLQLVQGPKRGLVHLARAMAKTRSQL